MPLQSLLQHGHSLVHVIQHPLQLDTLHHDPGSTSTGPGLLQQQPSSLILPILTLQLDGSQPDVLAVWVVLEGQGEDGASSRNITLGGGVDIIQRRNRLIVSAPECRNGGMESTIMRILCCIATYCPEATVFQGI